MTRSWIKTNATVTMVGDEHENAVNHTFNNVIQAVTDEQLVNLGKVLEALTADKVTGVNVSSVNHIANDATDSE